MTETTNPLFAEAEGLLPAPPPGLGRASLFLDFDGTLAQIAPRPDAVTVAEGLRETLRRLSRQLSGRLAIISGRSVAEIEGFLPMCGLGIAGSHGLEMRWPDGATLPLPEVREHDALIAVLQDFADAHPGVLVERKPLGAGLHYRGNPAAEGAARVLTRELATRHKLSVQSGKMVFELRPAGRHKGDAIRLFMNSAPFFGGTPWFLGDDVTDEDGFAAVRDLGGVGILVGPPRATAARYGLRDVAAVHQWLEHVEETAR